MKSIPLRSSDLSKYLVAQIDESLLLSCEKELMDFLRSRSESGLQMHRKPKASGTVVELVHVVRDRDGGRVVLMRTPPGSSPENNVAQIMDYLLSEEIEVKLNLQD